MEIKKDFTFEDYQKGDFIRIENKNKDRVEILKTDVDSPYPLLAYLFNERGPVGVKFYNLGGVSRDEDLLYLVYEEPDVDEKMEEIIHEAWCEGNDQGYKDGKEDALMDMPHWKKADRDWIDRDICYLTLVTQDGGDYPDYEVVAATNRIIKGEWYLDICDLDKLPKDE